jgi:8-oxo-dGTP pyrophosphatase MutT (NUDIX family)
MPGQLISVYAGEAPPEGWNASVFLAGPTPRDPAHGSWRPQALRLLAERWTQDGRLVVFIPESRDGKVWPAYDHQVAWEDRWLSTVDCVLFWVPREMARFPGLTTNVEFGRYESSGRVVLGYPPEAESMRYLHHHAALHGAAVLDTLAATVDAALAGIGAGACRAGGRRDVPLLIWRKPECREWLAAQEAAGNELRGARVQWAHRRLAVLHASVWVAEEQRLKDNEVVILRPDVASVVAYAPEPRWEDTRVVLVREFRVPANTADGYVRELPGGSGAGTPLELAVAELAEETGLHVDPGRLRAIGARQQAATLAAHKQHVFAVELAADELGRLLETPGPHGNDGDSERTYVEVWRIADLLTGAEVDWTTLGAILQAVRPD